MRKINPPTKNRRDIGKAKFPVEKMMAERELSSCCIAIEEMLEIDAKQSNRDLTQAASRP